MQPGRDRTAVCINADRCTMLMLPLLLLLLLLMMLLLLLLLLLDKQARQLILKV